MADPVYMAVFGILAIAAGLTLAYQVVCSLARKQAIPAKPKRSRPPRTATPEAIADEVCRALEGSGHAYVVHPDIWVRVELDHRYWTPRWQVQVGGQSVTFTADVDGVRLAVTELVGRTRRARGKSTA